MMIGSACARLFKPLIAMAVLLALGACANSPILDATNANTSAKLTLGDNEPVSAAFARDAERTKIFTKLASLPPNPPVPTTGGSQGELTTYMQSLVDRFVAQSPTPNRKIRAIVAECEAFTDETEPNGVLRFCINTLRSLGSESEIAFIAAHETTHALLGHTLGDAERSAAQQQKINMIYFFTGPNGRTAAETQAANENATLKRAQEREADLFGIDLMTKAGFNPNGAYTFFDLKRRSLLAKASYRDGNEAEQKRRIDYGWSQVKEFSDLGKVTAYGIMNAGDNAIMANLNDNDHASAEQAMKDVAGYIKKHYAISTAQPLGALPWKAKPKQFQKTVELFRTPTAEKR